MIVLVANLFAAIFTGGVVYGTVAPTKLLEWQAQAEDWYTWEAPLGREYRRCEERALERYVAGEGTIPALLSQCGEQPSAWRGYE
jgi:hypothetical protein